MRSFSVFWSVTVLAQFRSREKFIFDTLRVVSLGASLVCEITLRLDGLFLSFVLFCRFGPVCYSEVTSNPSIYFFLSFSGEFML